MSTEAAAQPGQPAPAPAPVPGKRRLIKKILKYAAGGMTLVMVGLQFVPVDGIGNNPSETFAVNAPPEVDRILRKACLDCHSHETRWPWYSRIAPGSWLILRDVKKGRARFNVSEWGALDEDERALDKELAWDEIASGEMPPWFYIIPLHPDARLTDEEKATLKAWLMPPK